MGSLHWSHDANIRDDSHVQIKHHAGGLFQHIVFYVCAKALTGLNLDNEQVQNLERQQISIFRRSSFAQLSMAPQCRPAFLLQSAGTCHRQIQLFESRSVWGLTGE